MIKELLKNEYKVIQELNDTCTTEELQEIVKTIEELQAFKLKDGKLSYVSLNSAIIRNGLHSYETAHYDKYIMQATIEPFEAEYQDFIVSFCESLDTAISEARDLSTVLDNFDNYVSDDFRYYLENLGKTQEEIEEIIEKLGV
jgi:hypothetical protein